MQVKITPVSGKLLIKIEKLADQTKSGIKLVKTGAEWQNETLLAEIVAKPEDNHDVEVGQVVVVRGDAGRWIDPELVEDREYTYRIIEKDEVIGIVTNASNPSPVLEAI